MIVKKHNHSGRLIVAACDESILGKRIEEDDKVLDLTSAFYKGTKVTKEEFLDIIKKSYIINAVGKDVVDLLLNNHVISKEETKEIGGIPYIQVVYESMKL